MRQLLAIITFCVLVSSVAQAATYYMRADGTAANKAAATGPGSTQAACMNVSVHNSETFAAGDVIYLCDDGGNYTSTITPPTAGSSGNVITYAAESGDSPIINTSSASGMDLNVAYLDVSGIEFQGGSTGQIDLYNASADYCTIHDCTFTSPSTFGVYIRSTDSVQVYDCTGTSTATAAVICDYAGNTNLLIHDNEIATANQHIYTASAGTRIYSNTLTGHTGSAPYAINCIASALIYDNTIYMDTSSVSSTSGYGIRVNGGSPDIYRNKVWYCAVGIRVMAGSAQIWSNITFWNYYNGIDASGTASGVLIYNNVSAFNGNHGFVMQSGADSCVFKNNIGWADGTIPFAATTNRNAICLVLYESETAKDATINNNCWLLTNPTGAGGGTDLAKLVLNTGDSYYDTLSAWQTALSGVGAPNGTVTGQDDDSVTESTPLSNFVDVTIAERTDYDFRLLRGCVCIDAGEDLGDDYDEDYIQMDQDEYGDGWEIGPFAFLFTNNFTGSQVCASYDFEDDLTDSSSNSNTLTAYNTPEYSATYYKSGSKGGYFDLGNTECAYRADDDLSAGFAGRSSTGSRVFSIAAWVRFESLGTGAYYIASKYRACDNGRSWAVGAVYDSGLKWVAYQGTDSGSAMDTVSGGTCSITPANAITTGQWYHVVYGCDASGNITFNVYDQTNDATDSLTGAAWDSGTGVPLLSIPEFVVAGRDREPTVYDNLLDGWLDEVVIFNKVLSSAEIAAIRAGNYPPSGAAGPAIHRLNRMRRR